MPVTEQDTGNIERRPILDLEELTITLGYSRASWLCPGGIAFMDGEVVAF